MHLVGGAHDCCLLLQGDVAAEAEIENLKVVIGKHDKNLEQVQSDAAGAEQLVAEVQAELDGVGGEPMREQKDTVETLKQVRLDTDGPRQ